MGYVFEPPWHADKALTPYVTQDVIEKDGKAAWKEAYKWYLD